MATDLENAVEALYGEMGTLSGRMAEIKKTINSLSALMGKPQPFSDVELSNVSGSLSIAADQFFGKGLATAVKEFLKMRGRAVPAKEIYEALKAGGYDFGETKAENIQYRNLTISLSKNTNDFVYVKSSDAYGLWEFYPEKKRERKGQKGEPNKAVIAIDDSKKTDIDLNK